MADERSSHISSLDISELDVLVFARGANVAVLKGTHCINRLRVTLESFLKLGVGRVVELDHVARGDGEVVVISS